MSQYGGAANLEAMEEAVRYNRFLLDLIRPLARGRRVLDFGAGAGSFARRVAPEAAEVLCVEPDATLLPGAHRAVTEIPAASVDLVYSLNVLEHIEDDAAALGELRRVLRPGGTLLLYVPAFMLLYSAMDRRIGHLRRYRKAGLRRVVEQAGFRVDEVRYADSLGFAAALAFRALGPRDGGLNPRAVRFYDRYLFPLSRMLDVCLDPVIGKNLVLRATKP
jgi:ubiquinone/menaquinone biosynthesis C-methylase UbiE